MPQALIQTSTPGAPPRSEENLPPPPSTSTSFGRSKPQTGGDPSKNSPWRDCSNERDIKPEGSLKTAKIRA